MEYYSRTEHVSYANTEHSLSRMLGPRCGSRVSMGVYETFGVSKEKCDVPKYWETEVSVWPNHVAELTRDDCCQRKSMIGEQLALDNDTSSCSV